MSYAAAAALQAAVYQRLRASTALEALVDDRIYDSVPPGTVTGTWISIGPEDARDASDITAAGAWHEFVVSVVTDEPGFQGAKDAAAAVSDALTGAELLLIRGRLVGLWFLKARARRAQSGTLRRIDMTFRARTEV